MDALSHFTALVINRAWKAQAQVIFGKMTSDELLSDKLNQHCNSYSPPQDSLTPSSEYSRSPRESADSEMLGLSYSSLAIQRRSIPSVLVDVGDGSSHYLSTKDCYARRGSTGRALPKIPEPSRSVVQLVEMRILKQT